MTSRTDTERLDWLEKNTKVLRRPDDGGLPYYDTVRESFDAAMDVEEGKELEEAWRMFRQKVVAAEWDIVCLRGGEEWRVGIAKKVHEDVSRGPTADSAILAAYRASRGSIESDWRCEAPCLTRNPDSYNVCQSCKKPRSKA